CASHWLTRRRQMTCSKHSWARKSKNGATSSSRRGSTSRTRLITGRESSRISYTPRLARKTKANRVAGRSLPRYRNAKGNFSGILAPFCLALPLYLTAAFQLGRRNHVIWSVHSNGPAAPIFGFDQESPAQGVPPSFTVGRSCRSRHISLDQR